MTFKPADGHRETFKFYEEPDAVGAVRVGGTDILGEVVNGVAEVADMAQALADQINAHTSDPDYTARAVDNKVFIIAPDFGEEDNGRRVEVDTFGDVEVINILNMAGGVAPQFLEGATSEPGRFVKTHGAKIYSLSKSVKHFSGIGEPTIFTPEAVGAGFIDLATYITGAENLISLENYFDNLAVFSRNTTQIWSVDPDPIANRQEQVLRNIGTFAPQSVAGVGDIDLFFLSDRGIRSLRPRGEAMFAGVEDVGLPIDDIVLEQVKEVPQTTAERARAVVEPMDQRYWLAVGDTIYVLSRYISSKISAWAQYTLGFNVEEMVSRRNEVYIRSGNTIYLYGGVSGDEYDESPVRVRVPYLDAQQSADGKFWNGLNIAGLGEWTVTVYTDPNDENEADDYTILNGVTYGKERIPIQGYSTHLSLLFEHEADTPAKLSTVAAYFESGESG